MSEVGRWFLRGQAVTDCLRKTLGAGGRDPYAWPTFSEDIDRAADNLTTGCRIFNNLQWRSVPVIVRVFAGIKANVGCSEVLGHVGTLDMTDPDHVPYAEC